MTKVAILTKLATGRRSNSDGEQICLTEHMLALILEKSLQEIIEAIAQMMFEGVICRPFQTDERFIALTLKGQADQPIKFAK